MRTCVIIVLAALLSGCGPSRETRANCHALNTTVRGLVTQTAAWISLHELTGDNGDALRSAFDQCARNSLQLAKELHGRPDIAGLLAEQEGILERWEAAAFGGGSVTTMDRDQDLARLAEIELKLRYFAQ